MLAVGLLVLAQALPATNESSKGEAGAPCTAVLVSSPQITEPRLRWFSASQILDLEFRTMLARPLKGQHVLELKVYTPKGHLYQVLTVPFAAPLPTMPAPKPMRREPIVESRDLIVEGREPVVEGKGNDPATQATPMVVDDPDQPPSVAATFPVGGTAIVTSSLYGHWTVTPHLDGSLQACGPARQFRIEQ